MTISGVQKQQLADQGYLTVRGLLDARSDIDPFRAAYIGYLDTLADIFIGETNPDLRADFSLQPFAERFATLLGCSQGKVLQHIDPSLSIFTPGYQRMKHLPSAQRPELFHLMRNERLLDALEVFLGPEISVSPIYHFNLKLTQRQLKKAARLAAVPGKDAPSLEANFHVGKTGWHTDAAFGLPDAQRSRIINAWIPITAATTENGCLLVVPGSQRFKPALGSFPESVIAKAVPVTVEPGDVVFMNNNILHASEPNRSTEDVRWAFNFRYLPTGEPTRRPYLPEFVARSRQTPQRELRAAQLWSDMWQAALDFLAENPPPPQFGRSLGRAEAITARWRAATPDYTDWLHLAKQ